MAHFAELDENNKVIKVLAVADTDIQNQWGYEEESIGIALLKDMFGEDTVWVQTSYSNSFRGIFAGAGMSWNGEVFVEPQPWPSWSLDWRGMWVPPVEHVHDGRGASWDEDNQEWVVHPHPGGWHSWTWNSEEHRYIPPIPLPDDAGIDKPYDWDEESQSWFLP
jgi:hypothetical protein